jgi:hypothetical protein
MAKVGGDARSNTVPSISDYDATTPRRRPLPKRIIELHFQVILNIRVGRFSDKLVSTYQTRWCHISEYHNMKQRLTSKQASYFKTYKI